jgi:hypothetical protein
VGHGLEGLAGVALAWLLAEERRAGAGPVMSENRGLSHLSHFPSRAKRVIFIHLVGAPSQLDLFDHKPHLVKHDGELLPDSLWQGLRLAFIRERPKLMGSRFEFRRCGESGMEISELLPHLGQVADELAVMRSVHTEQFNHAPAQLMMQTGSGRFGRPSMGAWASYGLSSESHNLPAFVVLNSGELAGGGNSLWGSGFLPSVHQGVELRSRGDPVLFLSNPEGIEREDRRRLIESVRRLNSMHLADAGDGEIATRIQQYEMAFRMQQAVPELMDISSESAAIHETYGTRPGEESFANHCLLARRLVERGVRFVQLYDSGWDHHQNLSKQLPEKCRQVDRPVAALIRDLRQRGLLDETLVVWASEFGRTPMRQEDSDTKNGSKLGRDHHKDAFTVWLAGGGVRGGTTYGATDELGFHAAENPVHIRDLHATMLHLLGLDHERLTFHYQGRDYRLTDIGGHVVRGVIA